MSDCSFVPCYQVLQRIDRIDKMQYSAPATHLLIRKSRATAISLANLILLNLFPCLHSNGIVFGVLYMRTDLFSARTPFRFEIGMSQRVAIVPKAKWRWTHRNLKFKINSKWFSDHSIKTSNQTWLGLCHKIINCICLDPNLNIKNILISSPDKPWSNRLN